MRLAKRLMFWLIGGVITYCMVRHTNSDWYPFFRICGIPMAKEWIPAFVMAAWSATLWHNDRVYAYSALLWAIVGFWYGFTPYMKT